MKWVLCWAILISGATYFTVRFPQHRIDHLAEQREKRVATTQGDISVAVVWPREKLSFLRGVRLATDEINAAGGVPVQNDDGEDYQSKFRLRFFDEQDIEYGLGAARFVAREQETLVAIGHDTDSAMGASIIYNTAGILYLAPTSLKQTLTQHGFGLVFRMAPDEQQYAAAMVKGIATLLPAKQVRLAVLYPVRNTTEQGSNSGTEKAKHASLKPSPRQRLDSPGGKVKSSGGELAAGKERDGQQETQVDLGEEFTRFANSLLEPFGDRIRIEVVLAKPYHPTDKAAETLALLREHPDLYDVALILDVVPTADELRKQLESDLAKLDQTKLTLSLDELNWSEIDIARSEFLPAAGMDFYKPVIELVLRQSKQNIAIISSRDTEGTSLGTKIWSAVQAYAENPNAQVNLALFRSYQRGTEDFGEIVAQMRDKSVELVFLAGSGTDGATLIVQMREAGLQPTIICGPDFARPLQGMTEDTALDGVRDLIQQWLDTDRGKVAEERLSAREIYARLQSHGYEGPEIAVRRFVAEENGGTFVASTFDPDVRSEPVTNFITAFHQRYGIQPIDTLAAEGYQAMYLLMHAFRRSRSRSPSASAEALKLFVSEGSFENSRFSPQGEMLNRTIHLRRISRTTEPE